MKHSHMPCARAPSIVDKRGKIGFALGPGAQPQRPFPNVLPVGFLTIPYPPRIHQSRPWIGTLPGSFIFIPRLLTYARSNPDKGGSSSSRVGERRELTITSFYFSSYHTTCGWSWRGDAMFGVPMPDPVFDLLQSFLNGIYNARFRTITTHPRPLSWRKDRSRVRRTQVRV